MRKEMALIAAHAAWHMNAWDEMAIYVDSVDAGAGEHRGKAVGPSPAALTLACTVTMIAQRES